MVQRSQNPSDNAGDARDMGSIPGLEDPLEEGTANCPGVLAWRIPWTVGSSRLQSMGLLRVGQDSAQHSSNTSLPKNSLMPCSHQPLPTLPGSGKH